MKATLSIVDGISQLLVFISAAVLVLLVSVSLWEVFARYVLNAPTLWAFDIVNLCNGSLLALAAAYAQKTGAHVSIDVFSRSFPPRFGALLLAGMFIVLVLPTLSLLAIEATQQTWKFYQTHRVLESAWKPLRWPFYVPIAVGLWALLLQCLATVLRLIGGGGVPGDETTPDVVH
jgi:TRAP-type C4-dicarboxylate transport system permease small subunit